MKYTIYLSSEEIPSLQTWLSLSTVWGRRIALWEVSTQLYFALVSKDNLVDYLSPAQASAAGLPVGKVIGIGWFETSLGDGCMGVCPYSFFFPSATSVFLWSSLLLSLSLSLSLLQFWGGEGEMNLTWWGISRFLSIILVIHNFVFISLLSI